MQEQSVGAQHGRGCQLMGELLPKGHIALGGSTRCSLNAMKCLKLITSVCAMMLCQLPLPLLTQSDEKLVLRRSFPEVQPHLGATVRFYCNVSMVHYNYDEVTINWHKSEFGMIAQFSHKNASVKDERFKILLNRTTGTAELSIKDLWRNDSGMYYCERIDTSALVLRSNFLTLTVTENAEVLSTVTPEVVPPHTSDITVPVSVTSVSIAVLLLLLLGYILFLLLRKTEGQGTLGPSRVHRGLWRAGISDRW
uniref:Programmed cell death protein 1 isoform X2 n=1 Tax=Geotrypetes seraphini TaxID=260995 RepID=A0A6P8SG47_GEOSA|nr:programmed cell death protein 1 isoform X2 [Geotrypetes seraphini]